MLVFVDVGLSPYAIDTNLIENIIFTGDTIFVGRTGRIISTRSDINDLYDSVYKKILKLPQDTYIYPGPVSYTHLTLPTTPYV